MMIEINLLPWRERSRKIKKVKFIFTSSVFLAVTFLAFIACHIYYSMQLNKQNRLIQYLQNEINLEQASIADLDEKKKNELQLQIQLQFVMNLYAKSFRAVQLLNELNVIVPNNIALLKVERNDNLIKLVGVAQSDDDITQFKQAIEKSAIFSDPKVSQITSEKNSKQVNFQVEILQKD